MPPQPTRTATPAPAVRNHTGDKFLTLSYGYTADLDSLERTWEVQQGTAGSLGYDIRYSPGLEGGHKTDFAVVTGAKSYDTCASETGYESRVDQDEAQPGTNLCARTSGMRFAYITIKKVRGQGLSAQIDLDVTVWDPPFEE